MVKRRPSIFNLTTLSHKIIYKNEVQNSFNYQLTQQHHQHQSLYIKNTFTIYIDSTYIYIYIYIYINSQTTKITTSMQIKIKNDRKKNNILTN